MTVLKPQRKMKLRISTLAMSIPDLHSIIGESGGNFEQPYRRVKHLSSLLKQLVVHENRSEEGAKHRKITPKVSIIIIMKMARWMIATTEKYV